jgi:tungstate transport system substrate-binding protein
MRTVIAGFVLSMVFFGVGCRESAETCLCRERILKVSSTTSVDNTGLLKAILPPFEKRTGIKVQVLAVGTGQALKLAEMGDVDAVFVHDRIAEAAFVESGYGIHRTPVMHNDFVIVGPPDDPAGAKGDEVAGALKKIADGKSIFVSRGDESGTHKAELRLWKAAGIEPEGGWYLESGRGQRLNLNMADEKQGYCFIDRATFLTAEDRVDLEILVEGDRRLHNPYSIIPVNPARYPEAAFVEAMALVGFLTSAEGQKRIGEFKVKDKILFHPDALSPE